MIDDAQHEGSKSFSVSVVGAEDVARAAQQAVEFVNEHAQRIPQDYPDAAAIDAQLQRELTAARTASGDEDDGAAEFITQLRLVVLAAMGRPEQARALLAGYAAEPTDEAMDRDDRRFVRQLTRWLDAGGPVSPAAEVTLARLPRRAPRPRPSWSEAKAQSTARKEALDAVRAMARGKNIDQLKELIVDEYGARDIEIAPSAVDLHAKMLQVEQQPFGRARTALTAIRMLTSGGGAMMRLIKHVDDEDPEWLRRPVRAAYPMLASRHRYAAVDLDASAQEWLERVRTEASLRMGRWLLIDVWLTSDGAGAPLVVHIGERRVGTVGAVDSIEYDPVMGAAALFDEDPFMQGRLVAGEVTRDSLSLEIALPERATGSSPS